MRAIETRYKGFRFRSRTEARWAVFFDAVGVAWEYEIEGFRDLGEGEVSYLPDFWLPDHQLWVEIKGASPNEEEEEFARLLAEEDGYPVLLLLGQPMHPRYRNKTFSPHRVYHPDGRVEETSAHEALGIDRGDRILLKAYGEAAGARFEHGEKPRARQIL